VEEAAVVVFCDDVVDPVVRLGGPGEYMAAAEPGLEGGIGKFSGSILFPLVSLRGNANCKVCDGWETPRSESTITWGASVTVEEDEDGLWVEVLAADDLFLRGGSLPDRGSGFRIFL